MAYYKFGDVFIWFVARVVDINDPEKLGRLKIRVIHDQTGALGSKEGKLGGVLDEDLLWAYPLSAIQSASLHQSKINELEKFKVPEWIDAVGLSPTGIAKGTYVFGFYLDGHEQNIPMIFGTYHKRSVYPEPVTDSTGEMLQVEAPVGEISYYPDIAKLATGEQTLPKSPNILGAVAEPDSAYGTVYPYNLTYTTKSGHAIELDDTPGAERIHLWHKSASYEEINYQGRRVTKSVADVYDIGLKNHLFSYQESETGEIGIDQNIHIGSDRNIRVDSDDSLIVGCNQTVNIGVNQVVTIGDNQTVVVGKNCDITVGGNCTINVSGDATITAGGSMSIDSGGAMSINAGGTMTLTAPQVNIN